MGVHSDTDWIQQHSDSGPTPRRTAWMVEKPCQCSYNYSGDEVSPQPWPDWMSEAMTAVMPLCGLKTRGDWPNSCNLNLYENENHSVGWHADNEELFQGWRQDCAIISLSLGQARYFEVYAPAAVSGEPDSHCRLELRDGDLFTMEGLFQK